MEEKSAGSHAIRASDTGAKDGARPHHMLRKIYAAYDRWVSDQETVCKPGCATCCTQSVTLSTLEAEFLLDYASRQGVVVPHTIAPPGAEAGRVTSTNQFARSCLAGQGEAAGTTEGNWDYAPCIFLTGGRCSIYEARPFACRSFMSTIACDAHGYAVISPEFVTLNSLIMQLIEHMDQGRYWGQINALLARIAATEHLMPEAGGSAWPGLTVAEPVPGFLVPAEDRALVESYLDCLAWEGLSVEEILQSGTGKCHV